MSKGNELSKAQDKFCVKSKTTYKNKQGMGIAAHSSLVQSVPTCSKDLLGTKQQTDLKKSEKIIKKNIFSKSKLFYFKMTVEKLFLVCNKSFCYRLLFLL